MNANKAAIMSRNKAQSIQNKRDRRHRRIIKKIIRSEIRKGNRTAHIPMTLSPKNEQWLIGLGYKVVGGFEIRW